MRVANLRGVMAGLIALASCAIGMAVLAKTTWGVFGTSASVIGVSRLDTIPLVVGIGESFMGLLVYRLLSSSTVLWPSGLLLLFIVLGWGMYHVERSVSSLIWNHALLGYPAALMLGLWIGIFAILTGSRWVAPRAPRSR